MDGLGTKCRRNIAENHNGLSRVHDRYRRQTTDRQTTDGRATAYIDVHVLQKPFDTHNSVRQLGPSKYKQDICTQRFIMCMILISKALRYVYVLTKDHTAFTCHPQVYPHNEPSGLYSPVAENQHTVTSILISRFAERRRLSWSEVPSGKAYMWDYQQ